MARSILTKFAGGSGLACPSLIVENDTVDCRVEVNGVRTGRTATGATMKEEDLKCQPEIVISTKSLTWLPVFVPVLFIMKGVNIAEG